MNLFILDDDLDFRDMIYYVKEIYNNINITFCTIEEKSIELYKRSIYDFVIIDLDTLKGMELLDYIILNNIDQKIIVLGNKLECCVSMVNGCASLAGDINIKRLFKPLDIIELSFIINNFDQSLCKYCDKFDSKEGIIDILDDIIKKYFSLTYDKVKKTITLKNGKVMYKEIIEVSDLLNEHSIKHSFVNECTIKILDS